MIIKKIILILVTVFVGCFFLIVCKKPPCDIEINYPDDIKSIDWNNYNDVYTFFWNYLKNDCIGSGFSTGDTIKVYGILDEFENNSSGIRRFQLIDEKKHEYHDIYDHLLNKYKYLVPSVRVFSYSIAGELQSIMDTFDITKKKCYLMGVIGTIAITGGAPSERCCFTVPSVYLHSINDIIFEE